jgi:tetratricopeptide (TPR) repeat protein
MNSYTVRFILKVAGLVVALLMTASVEAQTDELADVNQMLKLGQYDQALTRVNSYLSTRPKDARGRFLKGLILAEQNKPNDAIKVFSELTQDYPDLPGPYNNLAVLYAAQGQYDKARGALEQAIRTHPSYATAHENLGDIYAKMASQAYDKALQLDKSNTTAQFPVDPRNTAKTAAVKPEAAKPASVYDPTKVATATPNAAATTPVAAKPAPAVREPEPAAKSVAKARDPEEVLTYVNAWAKSWSNNDVPAYLAAYAPDFRTPRGEPRAAWEAERRARVAKPRKIQVTMQSVKVDFQDANRATVSFVQYYNSDILKSVNNKVLVMTKSGDKWLIQQEQSGG